MDGKRTHVSLLAALHGHPFAITEAGLSLIVAIASRQAIDAELLKEYRRQDAERPPSAFMASPGERVEGSRRLRLREDGVGILAVRGPMIRHADLFDEISGATSMATLANEVQFALDSPKVKSLVLDIESPGGEIPAELAETVRAANSQKPVTAYIGNWGMSAAYWTAAGAGRTVAHRTAYTGSVGVRATFIDTTRLEESLGIDTIEMMADQSPDKIADPKTPEGKALIQRILNKTAEDFIGDVASFRGVSQRRVRSDFGKGAAVDAPRAAEVGMIDALDTMEGVIAAVRGGRRYKPSRVQVGSNGQESAMARKTWGQLLMSALGSKAHEEIDDETETLSAAHVRRSAGDTGAGDDPENLRARLAAETKARQEAEKRADAAESSRQIEAVAAQERDLKAKVAGWVGTRIDPAERAAIENACLTLARADRSGGTALLPEFLASIESRPILHRTDEVVVSGKVPAGGNVVQPPSNPDRPEKGDPWKAAREKTLADVDSASNGQAHK